MLQRHYAPCIIRKTLAKYPRIYTCITAYSGGFKPDTSDAHVRENCVPVLPRVFLTPDHNMHNQEMGRWSALATTDDGEPLSQEWFSV